MAETKRRPPAIFDRALGEYQPAPKYIAFPEFEQPPPPASPVIAHRYGQDVLQRAETMVGPQRFPFPYWQEPPLPANAVIGFRYGQVILVSAASFVSPSYVTFPFGIVEAAGAGYMGSLALIGVGR